MASDRHFSERGRHPQASSVDKEAREALAVIRRAEFLVFRWLHEGH